MESQLIHLLLTKICGSHTTHHPLWRLTCLLLHFKPHRSPNYRTWCSRTQHTSTHTHRDKHPGHCLSFLMRYQREGLSNDLTWQLISSIAHGNNYCHKSLPTPLLAAPSTFASQWQHSLAESTCSRLGVMIQKKREKFPWLRLNYVYAYMQWGRPSVQINTWKSSESCIAWFLLSSR